MADISTLGVTVADVSAQVHNLTINEASSPTTTQVEDYIVFAAAEVASEAQAAGIDVSGLVETDSAYMLLKKAIISKVTSEVMVARNRGDMESGRYYLDNYLRVMETLRRYPQRVETDTVNGPDLATFVEQTTSQQQQDIAWYGTIAGRVFLGGL